LNPTAHVPKHAAALRIHGNLSTLELAPVLLALAQWPEDEATLRQGGIMGLYGLPGDLPNLHSQGSSDLATNSETQALRYSIAHPDLRLILTVSQGLYRIVARRSAGIAQLADLKGKRVGTMPRTSSAYFLERSLRTVGLGIEDIEVVPFVAGSPVPLTLIPNALKEGKLDAATVWEPHLQRAQDLLGADAIEFPSPCGYREQFSLYSTAAKLADPALRPRIVKFVRTVIQASRQLELQPQTVWPLLAEAMKEDASIVERCWPHHCFPASLPPELLDVMDDEEAWVARETGRIPRGRHELTQLIDSTVLAEARTP
jgi:NitT/TauT family transport system substrate-binding protein